MSAANAPNYRHGASSGGRIQPEYRAWTNIRYICRKAAQSAERGTSVVKVCPAWDRDFNAFLAAVGPRPSPQHILQRHDAQGDWGPGNVAWSLRKPPPDRRRRNTRFIEVEGRRVTVVEAAAAHGLNSDTLLSRITRGWPIERAIETPARHREIRS